MSAPALSTLQHVTEKKLDRLARHQNKFEADKQAILNDAAACNDLRGKVKALLDGFKRFDIKPRSSDVSLANLEIFVRQAHHDPSVSTDLLRAWQVKLEHELDIATAKYDYTALFGKLVIEWIQHPNPASAGREGQSGGSDSDSEMGEGFDTLGRKEMYEQRKEWESYAFVERRVDEAKIESYLNDIFTSKVKRKVDKSPLDHLRDELSDVMDFKSELQTPEPKDGRKRRVPEADEYRFTLDKLESCIDGLLKTDLLAGKKREALVHLRGQKEVLKELVVVLNMDLENLDEWEWEPSPVPMTMRRQLNGKYRVFMDQETHSAIILHFIGHVWTVAMKKAFTKFARSSEWKDASYQSMGNKARERRRYYLSGSDSDADLSVGALRKHHYMQRYFMLQLPDDDLAAVKNYNAEDQDDRSGKSFTATKQNMLRLVTAEMLLNKKLYGEFFVVQSDFKWFGPSFSHATILTVLKFFEIPEKWLRFFKKFLEAPVVFAQDGPKAEVQVRKCGIPMSYLLSDALSEAVLFCLDYACNKRTNGFNIYRFHDDLWVWGQEKTCVQAWDTIREFSHIMGLTLNEEKTGTALISGDEAIKREIPAGLPEGKIKWGFLYLDPEAGRWIIDRAQVDDHIEELRLQLAACGSAMSWIQAWNSYVSRFFRANFADPANSLGPKHNAMIIETFEHIQKKLFSEMGTSNVTDYLRGYLKQRFGVNGFIPDAFFYFPVELGGLGVRNPFVDAFATSKKSFLDPEDVVERAFEHDQLQYNELEKLWQKGKLGHRKDVLLLKRRGSELETNTEANEPFMAFDEYVKYREETSINISNAYQNLLLAPDEEDIEVSPELLQDITDLELSQTTYWRWIYNLYGTGLKHRFGGKGLQFGERELLPLGLVSVLASEKVRWQG